MRIIGVGGHIVNGAEASALDVLEIEGDAVRWTVALPNAGPAATFESDDPAVAAFLRRAFGFRAMPSCDPVPPTSGAGPGGCRPGPG